MYTERRSRNRIVLVIEPRHPIEDENEDDEENLRGVRTFCEIVAQKPPLMGTQDGGGSFFFTGSICGGGTCVAQVRPDCAW